MNTAASLKALVRDAAEKKGISPRLALQNYMTERFLERVSLSGYRDRFIIGGAFLIASMIGPELRTAAELNAAVKGIPADRVSVLNMIRDILAVPLDDGVRLECADIRETRRDAGSAGFRISLTACCGKISAALKLLLTVGDGIPPGEIKYAYRLSSEDRDIRLLARSLPAILAEKLEGVISRGDQNTRPEDYYDVFILTKRAAGRIDPAALRAAVRAAAERKGSAEIVKHYKVIMQLVRKSAAMKRQWANYRKTFRYAAGIEFEEVCGAVVRIMEQAENEAESEAPPP